MDTDGRAGGDGDDDVVACSVLRDERRVLSGVLRDADDLYAR